MAIRRVEPDEAKSLLDSDGGYAYLDVRTTEEFATGRVPGSVNIPVFDKNPRGAGFVPNPEFVAQVTAQFEKDAPLIVACLRGGRSMKAAEMLIAAGFTGVVDMRGGYDAELDAAGNVTCEGWTRRGLPTTTD